MTLRVGIISAARAWRRTCRRGAGPGRRGRRHLHRGPGDGGSGGDDARRRDAVLDARRWRGTPSPRGRRRHPAQLPARHVPGALRRGARVHRHPVRRRPRRGTLPRDAAASVGTVAVVDAYSEHFGVFRFAEEVLADGTLGVAQSVVGRLELSLFAQPTSAFPDNWFHDGSFGASGANNLGFHLLHLMVRLLGWSPKRPGRRRSTSIGGTSSTDPAGSTWRSTTPRWRRCASGRGPSGCSPRRGGAAAPGFHLEIAGDRRRLVIQAPMMPSGESTVLLWPRRRRARGADGARSPAHDRGHRPAERVAGRPAGGPARSFWLMTKAIVGDAEAHPDFARSYHVQSVVESIIRSAAMVAVGCDPPTPEDPPLRGVARGRGAAASSTPSTIVWYPEQRQMLPESSSRIPPRRRRVVARAAPARP